MTETINALPSNKLARIPEDTYGLLLDAISTRQGANMVLLQDPCGHCYAGNFNLAASCGLGEDLRTMPIEYQGRPVKKFRRSFQTACKRAGIEYPCRMYDIRHLFASVMLAGGADLAAVSKLLGHSTTQMTANVLYENAATKPFHPSL